MRQLRAFSARRGFRSQLAASSALQRGGGSSTAQVIPVVAVRRCGHHAVVGITPTPTAPTCTNGALRCGGGVAGVEAASSRRRGHHAYADAQGASDVISATAVPVDTIIVITYRG